ncbi:MAG: HAMP domain-containing protein [Spirochaetales bacterium]|nr:HAMP domain-containing protein [Spirochaetales bacterium]
MSKRMVSIRAKIVIFVILIISIVAILLSFFIQYSNIQFSLKEKYNHIKVIVGLTSSNISSLVAWEVQNKLLEQLLEMKLLENMKFILVYKNNNILGGVNLKEGAEYREYFTLDTDSASSTIADNIMIVTNPVIYRNEKTGYLVLGYSLESFYGNIGLIIFLSIAIFIVFLVIALTISLIFSNSLVKTIKQVTRFMYNLSQGKGDLTKSLSITSSDEVGRLAGNFNLFVSSIKKIIVNIKSISADTKNIGHDLTGIATETSSSINEISNTLQSSKDIINNLHKEIQNSAASIEQIVTALSNITSRIENQYAAVSESSSSIEEMTSSIQNISKVVEDKKKLSNTLSVTANNGLEKMEKATESVSKIAGFTEHMLEMIKIINRIAAQTDLLSMNAAIEAAHAGSAGRGFAVVAGEIRKLSEQTRTYSRQINESLKQIVDDINQATELNRVSGESFSILAGGITEIADAMEETNYSMNELLSGSREIVNALGSLIAITEEIKTGSSEINKSVRSINDSIQQGSGISTQTLNNIEEVALTAKQISDSMIHLLEIGKNNEKSISSMDAEINQFKTDEKPEITVEHHIGRE